MTRAPGLHSSLGVESLFLVLALAGAADVKPDAPLGRSFADVKPMEGGVSAFVDLDPNDLQTPLRSKFDSDGSGSLTAPELDTHQTVLASLVSRGLVVYLGEERCDVEVRDVRLTVAAQMLRVRLWFACPVTGRLRVEAPLLEHLQAGHVHTLTVRLPGGVTGGSLTAESPSWEEPGPPGPWQRLLAAHGQLPASARVGLGIGVGSIVLGALAYLVWRRRPTTPDSGRGRSG